MPALSATLSTVAQAEAECNAANVEENDYTVFSCQDLEFELELVVHSIAKKITFIDNQVRPLPLFLFSTISPTDYNEHSLDRLTEHDKSDTSTT